MARYKEGQTLLWHPINWATMQIDELHPWVDHEVIVLHAPVSEAAPMYQIRIKDAPKVNDPHAFDFWATEEELTPRRKRSD